MKFIIFLSLSICLINWSWFSSPSKNTAPWAKKMEKQIKELDKNFSGEFGVYIKDLETQNDFIHKASQFWYLSSTVKIPVAITLLKQVDEGKVKLSEKVAITKSDYRDGAGPTNWIKPGDEVSYQYLLNQMLIYSDNAATDLIIKKVGLDNVNSTVASYTNRQEFGPITTLLDVRKKAYSEFHPDAENLSNLDFFAIKKQRKAEKKLNHLAKLLKVSRKKLLAPDLTSGFQRYYSKNWNSAPLTSYATLLENLVNGKILNPNSTQKLLKILSHIHTGKKRIKRGLPRSSFFAHKTGTQHKQACDVGIIGDKKTKKAKQLILVCVKNWKKLSHAERIMAKVSRLLSSSEIN